MLLSFALCSLGSVFGATLEQAKSVYNKGDYAKALPMMEEQYKKSPKNASVNQWLGVCYYKTGQIYKSKTYFEFAASKNVVESNYYLALINYHRYDFAEAEACIEKYRAAMERAKKEVPQSVEALEKSVREASVMLDHVEKIVIIDSMAVDKERFFKAYNISGSCGSLNGDGVLPESLQNKGIDMVYASESGDRLMWSMADGDAKTDVYEMMRLYGGEWDKPVRLGAEVNGEGNNIYPFVMQDGVTLYYACDGGNTIGGYDIYMTRKDIETGEYLQPQNLGMPYNSPYDDYLLVIDEERNLGWWATDRNQIPDKITVYVFIPNATRVNYSADDSDIVKRAMAGDYYSTWEGKDYSPYVAKLHELPTNDFVSRDYFTFNVYNGIVYRNLSEFKTQEGFSMMEELLAMERKFSENSMRLKQMRKKYELASASEKSAMKNSILQLENVIDRSRVDIKWMENSIRKVEKSTNN